MNVDLPDGNTATFPDPDRITNGQRKRLFKLVNVAQKYELDPMSSAELMVASLIQGWSYEAPLPMAARYFPDFTGAQGPYTDDDPTPLDELLPQVVDKLVAAATEIVQAITPNVEPATDPASPPSPSGA